MSSAKSTLARDGTMQVTAKEGINYLESAGHDKLLKMQGLKEEDDKPGLARDNTMATTAKEGEDFLDRAGGNVDADAFTRGQQKKIEEIQSETPPPPKKPKIAKEGTMAVTAKEAKDHILKNEKLGDTRQETKAKAARGKATPKREGTIAKTMAEAKTLIGDTDSGSGRQTRSSARGAAKPPPPKRAGTMQKTAKDGKEWVGRGKKGKKEEETKEEDAEEASDN